MTSCVAFPLLFASRLSRSPVTTPTSHLRIRTPRGAAHTRANRCTDDGHRVQAPPTRLLRQTSRSRSVEAAAQATHARRRRENPSMCHHAAIRMNLNLKASNHWFCVGRATRTPMFPQFMTQYRPDAEATTFTVAQISLDVDGRVHLKPGGKSQHPSHRGYGVADPSHLLTAILAAVWRSRPATRRVPCVARLRPRLIVRSADGQPGYCI